jgi:hypothetical protein
MFQAPLYYGEVIVADLLLYVYALTYYSGRDLQFRGLVTPSIRISEGKVSVQVCTYICRIFAHAAYVIQPFDC